MNYYFVILFVLIVKGVSLSYAHVNEGSFLVEEPCKTHPDYEGKFFSVIDVLQEYTWVGELSKNQKKQIQQMFEKELWGKVFSLLESKAATNNKLNSKQLVSPGIFQSIDNVDDIEIKRIKLFSMNKIFLQFNVGIGGGNGMNLVFYKNTKGRYKLISQIMDGDTLYCQNHNKE